LGPVERESLEVFGVRRPYSLPRSSNRIGAQAGEAQCQKGSRVRVSFLFLSRPSGQVTN
jgi:hypothetical protein